MSYADDVVENFRIVLNEDRAEKGEDLTPAEIGEALKRTAPHVVEALHGEDTDTPSRDREKQIEAAREAGRRDAEQESRQHEHAYLD